MRRARRRPWTRHALDMSVESSSLWEVRKYYLDTTYYFRFTFNVAGSLLMDELFAKSYWWCRV